MDHNDTLFNILQPDDLTTVHPNAGRLSKIKSWAPVGTFGEHLWCFFVTFSISRKIWKKFFEIFFEKYLPVNLEDPKFESKNSDQFSKKFYQRLFEFISDRHQVPADDPWFD